MIRVDVIEDILMDYGSYEHSIESLDGFLTLNNGEIHSAAKAIYDYVMQNK